MATEIEYPATDHDCAVSWEIPTPEPVSIAEELDEWNVRKTIDWYDIEISVSAPKEVDIKTEFDRLVSEWKESTWALASIKRRVAHPAYLKIIGLGPVALPLIFRELRREPDYWHYALEAITRKNPVPEDADMKGVIDAWLRWGEQRGYCDPR